MTWLSRAALPGTPFAATLMTASVLRASPSLCSKMLSRPLSSCMYFMLTPAPPRCAVQSRYSIPPANSTHLGKWRCCIGGYYVFVSPPFAARATKTIPNPGDTNLLRVSSPPATATPSTTAAWMKSTPALCPTLSSASTSPMVPPRPAAVPPPHHLLAVLMGS